MEDRISLPPYESRSQFLVCGAAFILWAFTTLFFWVFAFWHLPEASPQWLVRAQSACFGTLENGLPDTYGWLILTLAPASIILGLFTACPKETLGGLQMFVAKAWGKTLGAGIVLATLSVAIWVGARIDQAFAGEAVDTGMPLEFPENYPVLNKSTPQFSLVDQHGAVISPGHLKGKVVFVSFVFAHCKTVCPALLAVLKQSMRSLGDLPVELLLISLDPWRDTPSSLPSLAKTWQLTERQRILTGSEQDVKETLENFQVATQRDETTGDIAHPALIYVIDQAGQIRYALNNPPAAWLVSAAKRTLDG